MSFPTEPAGFPGLGDIISRAVKPLSKFFWPPKEPEYPAFCLL